MRWRKRKQHSVLDALESQAQGVVLPDDQFTVTTSAHCVGANELCFLPQSQVLERDALQIVASPIRESVTLEARLSKIPIALIPTCHDLDNLVVADLRILFADLHIAGVPVTKVSFAHPRKENSLFGANITPGSSRRVGAGIVGAVDRQELDGDEASLEERLRWILTPPIHEQLSDPSLGLPCTPHDYQVRGIAWLRSRKSALLADEMGLGKTMQAIIAARLMWRAREIDRILVVCPKTLIRTWREEIDKWWPNASPNVCEPTGDTQRFLRLATPNVTIKIVNYEKLAREAKWLVKGDRSGSHDLIIIDEAQRIKNPATSTAKAVKALFGPRRWAITGTPLETKIEDVTSIFEYVRTGLLESTDAAYVRTRIRPFLLRRRLEEVSLELPDKDDQDVVVELGEHQRNAYERAEDEGVVDLNEKGESITVQHVFALIQKLMQLCNFDPVSGDSCKLDRMSEDLVEIIESGRKVLVFSQFIARPFGLKQLRHRLPNSCRTVEMHGEISGRARDAAEDAFKTDPTVNTMLLHYRVGGVGLNLQAANYVYLFNRWWNPAVEDQAVKRVHRIGQENKVFVRRLYCKDTIEERILIKLAERRRLFEKVIERIDESSPLDAMRLSEEEFFNLFEKLKARPKRVETKPTMPRHNLDSMNFDEFEILVGQLYEAERYQVRYVGGSHDGGVDVWAEKRSGAGRELIAIQCKHHGEAKAKVGRPDLQKLFGVVTADQNITRGALVTNTDFSAEARGFANGKRIELINRPRLVEWARELKVAQFDDA